MEPPSKRFKSHGTIPTPRENAQCTWDFTSFMIENAPLSDVLPKLREALIISLRNLTKKWCFQLEKAPTSGHLHLQGRFSLKTKGRMNQAKEVFKTIPKEWMKAAHLSPTSTENRDNQFYVMKEETRIQGPWMDTDLYVPRQVSEVEALYPWQEAVVRISQNWDTRSINVLIQETGGIGKSILTAHTATKLGWVNVPPMRDSKEIMGMIIDRIPERNGVVIIDIPKALTKNDQREMYAAIEQIKNGYAYDTRYKYREKWFDCPCVWVFTNTKPDEELLSKDRWVYWKVENNELERIY